MAAFDFSKTKTLEESGLRIKAGGEKAHPRNKFAARMDEQLKFLTMPAADRPKRGLLWKEADGHFILTPKLGSRSVVTYGKTSHVAPLADLKSALETLRDDAKAGKHDAELMKTQSTMGGNRKPARKAKSK